VSLQTAVLESVERQHAGVASGISSTSRYLGSIIGSFILANLLGSTSANAGNYWTIFLIAALAACGAGMISWGIHREMDEVDTRSLPC
jgi:sugar phosphate permease